MNGVTLLMRKELLYLFKNLKYTWVVSLIFMTVFCILVPGLSFVTVIIAPYFLIYGIMAHEEQNHSNVLNYTLPVSRRDICISKYLLGLTYAVMNALVVSLILSTGLVIGEGYNSFFNQIGAINIFGLLTGSSLIYTAVIIPIIYKFGCIKMRMVMLGIYILGFAASNVAMEILKEVVPKASTGYEVLGVQGTLSGVNVGILGVVVYLISYYISLKILKKKEIV